MTTKSEEAWDIYIKGEDITDSQLRIIENELIISYLVIGRFESGNGLTSRFLRSEIRKVQMLLVARDRKVINPI